MKPSLPVRVVAMFLMLVFLPGPLFVVIGASFSPESVLRFPPQGLSLRWYEAIWQNPVWLNAFGYSLIIAIAVAVVTTAAAVGAGLALANASERVRSIAETAILAPLLFPHAAIGIAFLSWLLEFRLNGSLYGVLVAHLIICVPFAYRPVAVSLRQIDREVVEAGIILGADRARLLWRVILPLLRPGIATSLLFTFIISFDEVTVTMFLVGPTFTTLPVSIYSFIHDSADPTVAAISTLLILMTALLVLALDKFAGLQFFVDMDGDKK